MPAADTRPRLKAAPGGATLTAVKPSSIVAHQRAAAAANCGGPLAPYGAWCVRSRMVRDATPIISIKTR